MTLHEAMAQIMRGRGIMSAKEIADKVNQLGLYRRGDGEMVPSNQIHARAKNYPCLFEKIGTKWRLKEEACFSNK